MKSSESKWPFNSNMHFKNERIKKIKKQLSKYKRRTFKHIWLVRFGILTFVVGIFFLLYFAMSGIIRHFGFDYHLSLAKHFIMAPKNEILSFEDKTNILILGKGGDGHEAPDLTDTIMVASLDLKRDSLVLISLPRDIWIPELRTKLNSTYYWGNKKQTDGGILLASSSVEEIVGIPIHYSAVLDFSAFEKVIDTLGGIEVEVLEGFTDKRYPIKGKENDECDGDPEYLCRYETITFNEGLQNMDSETALKFVRSRNAEGDEGTDIARSARQQQVVKAIIRKILSREIVFDWGRISSLIEIAKDSIETDVSDQNAAVLTRKLFDARNDIQSYVLPDFLIKNPEPTQEYDNLYVFIPSDGSWEKTHEWVECVQKGKENCIQ